MQVVLELLFLFTHAAFTRAFCWLTRFLLLLSLVLDVLFTSTQPPTVMTSRSNLRLLLCSYVCISNWSPSWVSVRFHPQLLPVPIPGSCFCPASSIHDAYILQALTHSCHTPLTLATTTCMADSPLCPGLLCNPLVPS